MDDTTSIRIKRSTVHDLTMIRTALQAALQRPVTSHDETINILMEHWKGSEATLEQYQEWLEKATA